MRVVSLIPIWKWDGAIRCQFDYSLSMHLNKLVYAAIDEWDGIIRVILVCFNACSDFLLFYHWCVCFVFGDALFFTVIIRNTFELICSAEFGCVGCLCSGMYDVTVLFTFLTVVAVDLCYFQPLLPLQENRAF